ncbi:MAG TPA: glycerophosphodiester phosphodiesterase family protein, partial [Labilithrix sp.]|nr:glycerophosphodiester phosphodiesterase family protein [Labilithrix sp.]
MSRLRASPMLYAHRGASRELPENTLEAFRLALELGADALETDAHMTRDGRIVLSHDPAGLRMAGVSC